MVTATGFRANPASNTPFFIGLGCNSACKHSSQVGMPLQGPKTSAARPSAHCQTSSKSQQRSTGPAPWLGQVPMSLKAALLPMHAMSKLCLHRDSVRRGTRRPALTLAARAAAGWPGRTCARRSISAAHALCRAGQLCGRPAFAFCREARRQPSNRPRCWSEGVGSKSSARLGQSQAGWLLQAGCGRQP